MKQTELLRGWLRSVQQLPENRRSDFLLTGSLLIASAVTTPRPVADLDYLGLVPNGLEIAEQFVAQVLAQLDPNGPDFQQLHAEVTVGRGYASAGWRVTLSVLDASPETQLQIDFFSLGPEGHPGAYDAWAEAVTADGSLEPISRPPERRSILGIPDVLTCSLEDLWAWKLHGLIEFGPGEWRAKDLYDLAALSRLMLPAEHLRQAAQVAFCHHNIPLDAMREVILSDTWGLSATARQKWQAFTAENALMADFLACRNAIRQEFRRVWPHYEWPELSDWDISGGYLDTFTEDADF